MINYFGRVFLSLHMQDSAAVNRPRRYRGPALAVAFLSSFLLCTSAAMADDWNIGLGAGVISGPEYIGSEDSESRGVLAVDIAYRDRYFFNFYEGFSAYLYNRGDFRLKAGLGYERGRDEDEDDSLRGTGDIDSAAVLSLGTEYRLGQYTAFANLRQHLGGTDGWQLQTGIQAFYSLRKAITSPRVLLNLMINYSDEKFMQGYFGIDADQSAASGYPEYSAHAGISWLRTGISYIHPLSERWRITAVLQVRKLLGDAVDSPLVLEDRQLLGGVIAGYRF